MRFDKYCIILLVMSLVLSCLKSYGQNTDEGDRPSIGYMQDFEARYPGLKNMNLKNALLDPVGEVEKRLVTEISKYKNNNEVAYRTLIEYLFKNNKKLSRDYESHDDMDMVKFYERYINGDYRRNTNTKVKTHAARPRAGNRNKTFGLSAGLFSDQYGSGFNAGVLSDIVLFNNFSFSFGLSYWQHINIETSVTAQNEPIISMLSLPLDIKYSIPLFSSNNIRFIAQAGGELVTGVKGNTQNSFAVLLSLGAGVKIGRCEFLISYKQDGSSATIYNTISSLTFRINLIN